MAVKFELKGELVQGILDYLLSRPVREVLPLIDEMRNLQPITVDETPASPAADRALAAVAE